MTERYRTPKGKDEARIPYPSSFSEAQVNELKRRGIYYVNWNGIAMAVGGAMDVDFYDDIAGNMKNIESVIIAILGRPGTGKTWAGLRLCEIFDKDFDGDKQIVFEREHMMKIISGETPIKPGQVVIIDEAHMGVGARSWYEDIQKDLINHIVAIRSMGIILIFVVLHIKMLDIYIREQILTYELHMERRGVVSDYQVIMPRFSDKVYHPKGGKIRLQVPGIDECDDPGCLRCDDRHTCINIRAVYERNKKTFLKDRSDKVVDKITERSRTDRPPDMKLIPQIYEYKDLIEYTNRDTIKPSSIQYIIEVELGYRVGISKCTTLGHRLQKEYLDLIPTREESI